MTKTGFSSSPFTKCSQSSSTSLPWVASATSTPDRVGQLLQLGDARLRRDLDAGRLADSDSYIDSRDHSPPRSNSVPSAQVTTCEPATAIAAFCTSSWVRSAIRL